MTTAVLEFAEPKSRIDVWQHSSFRQGCVSFRTPTCGSYYLNPHFSPLRTIDEIRRKALSVRNEDYTTVLPVDWTAATGAWPHAATGTLPCPVPEALVLKFAAHNLRDPLQRVTDPDHGMPKAVMDA
jgi:hypothetical protein